MKNYLEVMGTAIVIGLLFIAAVACAHSFLYQPITVPIPPLGDD